MALRRRHFLNGILSLPVGAMLAHRPLAGLTATVYNGFELHTALQGAGPGSTITLAPGNYGDVGGFHLASSEVAIRVQHPLTTILRAPLTVDGHSTSLEGLHFEEGIHLVGTGLKIANSRFTSGGISITGINVEVANCEIANFRGRGVLVRPTARNPWIHNNHIHNNVGNNGANEGMSIGYDLKNSGVRIGARVENNLLEQLNGEQEAISVKTSGNSIRGNTLRNSRSFFCNRMGGGNTYAGNVSDHAWGIVIQDRDNKLIGNRCINSLDVYRCLRIMGGNIPPGSAQKGNSAQGHPQAVNTLLDGNTADLTVIGDTWSGFRLPAVNTTVRNHHGKIIYRNVSGGSNDGSGNKGSAKSAELVPEYTIEPVGPQFA